MAEAPCSQKIHAGCQCWLWSADGRGLPALWRMHKRKQYQHNTPAVEVLDDCIRQLHRHGKGQHR